MFYIPEFSSNGSFFYLFGRVFTSSSTGINSDNFKLSTRLIGFLQLTIEDCVCNKTEFSHLMEIMIKMKEQYLMKSSFV